MLRITRRWHDAANGPPIDGEARLLWFAAPNPPNPNAPSPSGDQGNETSNESPLDLVQEVARRRAHHTLLEETPPSGTELKAESIADEVSEMRSRLEGYEEKLQRMQASDKCDTRLRAEINGHRSVLEGLRRRAKDQLYPLTGDGKEEKGMEMARWEKREMTPKEFLEKYEAYLAQMDVIDAANASLTKEQRDERKAARDVMRNDTREAVRVAKETLPKNFTQAAVQRSVADVTDEELWFEMYDDKEKDQIIQRISEAAGLTILKEVVYDDVSTINAELENSKIEEAINELSKQILAAQHSETSASGPAANSSSAFNELQNIMGMIQSGAHRTNQVLGIEWMTAYEWMDAFKEVWEGIKELRKQKSRLRVSRAASTIGKAVSLIPGMGGQALVALLDQQQEAKNEEIKDGYIKELKNSRIDYGFTDLFGDGKGNQGLLAYYTQIGDTNRTRAIIEFATGKGLLYGSTGKKASEYVLPGGIPFMSAMPPEMSTSQAETHCSNLQFMNKQGQDSMIKAGEEFASGRARFEDYTEPFKGAVNGLSLWFAKGLANKALTKVKEGEMSATLTLIVCDAWENNPLFREYMDWDWMDRLAGDSKQLLIGMIKYDKAHLQRGAEVGEFDIAKADAKFDDPDPNKRGKQRLGPLVAAVRSYLLELDPTLSRTDDKTKGRFLQLQAKLLACKRIGPADGLPEGKYGSFYSEKLTPYHIKYDPNEMRDAAVDKLGDDNFIERSEIINCTAEVMQYIGTLRENGFAEPTKARYFFSQIITAYEEMDDLAKQAGPQQQEFRTARNYYLEKQRAKLDQWISRALQQNGAPALLTEQHSDQKGRPLVLTLMKYGLISEDVVKKLSDSNVKAAKTLYAQYAAFK